MSLMAKGSSATFKQLEPNTYVARCVKLIDLGTQPGYMYQGAMTDPAHKVWIQWELPTELIEEGEYEGKPRVVQEEFTLSIGKKATLGQLLVQWRGRDFTDAERSGGYDVKSILGQPCVLNLTVNEKGYNKIKSLQPHNPKINAPCPPQIIPTVFFGIAEYLQGDPAHQKIYSELTEYVRKKIDACQEVKESRGQAFDDAPPPHGDDDIPF